MTIFAPTNEAFSKLDETLVNELLADKVKLQAVLLNHLLPSRKDVQSLRETITSVAEKELIFEKVDNEVFVNESKIIESNYGFKNGIMHKIDQVIL